MQPHQTMANQSLQLACYTCIIHVQHTAKLEGTVFCTLAKKNSSKWTSLSCVSTGVTLENTVTAQTVLNI